MIGQILDGRYRVVRSLGEGGFSKTFLAEDTRRPGSPICVVKHLQPARTDSDFLSVARRLFHSEAEALEKLGHHDQIPRLLAFFEEQQEFYLVQEFVPGSSLIQILGAGERWPEARVRVFLKELLHTLSFIHRQGVIHRDIKPDNIICRQPDQKYVLVDFGSVKQVSSQTLLQSDQMTGTVIVGTPGYMAGEQGQGKPRPSSDIYALGVVAIQALTGLHPSKLQEDDSGELIWQAKADVSPQLAAVLTRMVRYYFKLRYQSAEEVLQALGTVRTSNATVRQVSDSPRFPQPPRPSPSQTSMRTRVVSPPRFEEPAPRKSFSCMGAIATLTLVGTILGVGAVILNPELLTGVVPFLESLTATDDGPSLLANAQTTAETSGDLGTAIRQLEQISSGSSAYAQAQALLGEWQGNWEQQQTLFQQAEAAAQSRNWYRVRTLISRLPQNSYWDQQTSSLSRQARQNIAEIERVKSRPKPTPPVRPEPSPEPTPEPSLSETPEEPTDPNEPIEGGSTPEPISPAPPQLPVEIPVPAPEEPKNREVRSPQSQQAP